MIDLLPREIATKIFETLARNDLLNLMLTSKYFHQIIGENSSLCRKLELHFVPENSVLEWTGGRRYSRAYIEGPAAKYFVRIFEEFGLHLRDIQLTCMTIESATLKRVLLSCRHLRKLIVKDNRVSYDREAFDEPLPELQLQTLHYRNFKCQPTKLFRMLRKCTAKELIVVGYTRLCEDLRDFVFSQSKLATLSVSDIERNSMIFSANLAPKFRLHSLVLDKTTIDDFFRGFIEHHRLSLTYVDLNEVDQKILEILADFPNLSALRVNDMQFCRGTLMKAVKSLKIGYDVCGSWAENFPNVSTLETTWIRYERDLVQIERLKKLEKLHINFSCVPTLSIPSVRVLRLSDVGFSASRPFAFESNRIEELFLDNCTHGEWLSEFVERFASRLRLLWVKNTPLSDECRTVLEAKKTFRLQLICREKS